MRGGSCAGLIVNCLVMSQCHPWWCYRAHQCSVTLTMSCTSSCPTQYSLIAFTSWKEQLRSFSYKNYVIVYLMRREQLVILVRQPGWHARQFGTFGKSGFLLRCMQILCKAPGSTKFARRRLDHDDLDHDDLENAGLTYRGGAGHDEYLWLRNRESSDGCCRTNIRQQTTWSPTF
jgi:hypothetical protein